MPVILDIDIPKSCWECPCIDKENGWCQASEGHLCCSNSGESLPKSCPLKDAYDFPKIIHDIRFCSLEMR